MSSVFMYVGQCGNQLGFELNKLLSTDACSEKCHVYSHVDDCMRCVHLDTEKKVVQRLLSSKCRLRHKNVISGRKGRGNNWALGYHGYKSGEDGDMLETALDSLRKEVERCHNFSGVTMMHSLTGGTGSGFGSRLLEQIRDEYLHAYVMNVVVSPHSKGESPLQHYNGLLCLDFLQKYSDAVVLFSNDDLLWRLSCLAGNPEQGRISLETINQHVASCLSGVFLPTDTLTGRKGISTGLEPWEMIRSLTPDPSLKFAHINHISRRKCSWKEITSSLLRTIPRASSTEQPFRSLANLVVARGDASNTFYSQLDKVKTKVKTAYKCVEWNPFPVDCWSNTVNYIPPKDASTLTIAANYSNCTSYLNSLCIKVKEKLQAQAYLHWYEKYGCEKTDFHEALETIETVVLEYKNATS